MQDTNVNNFLHQKAKINLFIFYERLSLYQEPLTLYSEKKREL